MPRAGTRGTRTLVGLRFVSGHDQRALHERVAKIGTVAEFLSWFDQTYQGRGEKVGAGAPELLHGQPRAFRRSGWNLDKYEWPGGLELLIYDDGRVKLGSGTAQSWYKTSPTSRRESPVPARTSWPCSPPPGVKRIQADG